MASTYTLTSAEEEAIRTESLQKRARWLCLLTRPFGHVENCYDNCVICGASYHKARFNLDYRSPKLKARSHAALQAKRERLEKKLKRPRYRSLRPFLRLSEITLVRK